MAKYKIFVDGSSGTTGLRIADRLAARDEFEILHISEADRKDVNARAAVINQSDLSFLCLPDAAAKEVVPLLRPDVRILDMARREPERLQRSMRLSVILKRKALSCGLQLPPAVQPSE